MSAVDKVRAYQSLYRTWRRFLTVEQRDVLGLLIDQIAGLGRVSRALSYRDLINNEYAPAGYCERQLREHIAALEARGAIRVERPAGRKMVITLTLEREPRSDAAQPQTPAVRRRGGPEPRQSAAGDPGSRPPPPLNRPQNRPRKRGTDHEESSPAEPASAPGITGVDVLSSGTTQSVVAAQSAQPVQSATARRDPRRRLGKREYATAVPALRSAWENAHAAADWLQPGYRAPVWTGKDRGHVLDILRRLDGDVGKTCAFLAWSVTNWRTVSAVDKLRRPPEFPGMPFLTGYFERYRDGWQRNAERQWIDLLPREGRLLATLVASGKTRDEALVEIAERRALAKDREARERDYATIKTEQAVLERTRKEIELERRRGADRRTSPRSGEDRRAADKSPVRIKDTSPEEIKRVLDQDMAGFTPPDFDHDPYLEQAPGTPPAE